MRRSLRRPRLLGVPEAGWASLLLLLALLVLVGVSIANARPLQTKDGGSLSDPLPTLMLAAGLSGYLLARSRLGVVRAHVIGATVAAALLLLIAGATLLGTGSMVPLDLASASERIGAVWRQLDTDVTAYVSGDEPMPTLATFLVLGAICWTTAQFSAFSVFRYDRGGPAVMAIGTVLFLNLGLGSLVADAELLPVLPVLALFSALAMLLLMRLQLMAQRLQWARRHIADTTEVSRLFLRSGVLFVALTVLAATSLTAFATVEAQELDVGGLEDPIEDLSSEVARWLGLVGVPPASETPTPRGTSSAISDAWTPGTGVAFRATAGSGGLRGNYWWGWADDRYDVEAGRWRTSGAASRAVAAGRELPRPTGVGGEHQLEVALTLGEAQPPTARAQLFRPSEAAAVNRDVVVAVVDDGRSLTDIEFERARESGEEVTAVSYVRDYSEGATSLTANELRAAGQDYPAWVTEAYLQGANDGRIAGERVRAFVKIVERRFDNPYDRALEVQRVLREMDYVVSMGDACDDYGRSIPECVLGERKGFCQQYATTMVMALRVMGIPARFVTGYLPGELDVLTGVWTVEQAALHNWVEAYFPDYGWVRFDPTPGLRFGQAPTDLADGPEIGDDLGEAAEPTSRPLPGDEPTPEPTLPPAVTDSGASGGGGEMSVLLVITGTTLAVLALTVVSGLLLFRLRRMPDGDDGFAYRGVVSLATRLGYGPHPAQTEYEYARVLAEALPTVRDDLYVVADARVETAYGRRSIDQLGRSRLRRAYARIRTALLRLSVRRERGPRRDSR